MENTETIKVTRRNGIQTDLDITKIRNVVNWACEGLEADPLELERKLQTHLKNGVTTREIQDNLIMASVAMTDLDTPDYRIVAGRLKVWSLWKDTLVSRGYPYGDYHSYVTDQVEKGRYSQVILKNYTENELNIAGSWIDPDRDLDYDYAAMVLFTGRYLLQDELIQEAYLTIALLLAIPEHHYKMQVAEDFYNSISSRKLSLSTPILANLRTRKGSLGSCFITAMDDNLESIFEEITNTARISKNGGGVGVNLSRIRANGSWLMGEQGKANGVIPWIKLLNDTAIAVNQGGKRAGAVTVSLDSWHLDIEAFLEMQVETGDQRLKCYDVFPQVVLSDEFMRRVKNNQRWLLVDPYEIRVIYNVELCTLWGREFEYFYRGLEVNLDDNPNELTNYKWVDAKTLYKKIMETEVETGLPYQFFKDNVNKVNPNKHCGYIPSANLCVTPETKVLTDVGQIPIAELEGDDVNIWNGYEWSEVTVKKTGEDQPILTVNFSNGESLNCTYDHEFWVKNSYRGQPVKVKAKDLQPGNKLIKYNLPLVSNESDVEFPYAYTSGFFCGDGSYGGDYPEIDLYDEKIQLLDYLDIRNKLQTSHGITKNTDEKAVYNDQVNNKLVCKLPLDIPQKFTVPLNGYTVKSRLEWLAGLLDSDGCVHRNGDNESFCIGSIHKNFLLEVRLMLQTLGVDSKVTLGLSEGDRLLPDGKGGLKEYYCQQSYRLLISSNGLLQLAELGLKTHRLKWVKRVPQRNASQFIKVVGVTPKLQTSDTYCFTEPLRNLGMFNGILTGQCVESYSNVSPGKEAHTCNLTSVNLANINGVDDLEKQCRLAVRLLDNSIDISKAPFGASNHHNNIYRTIGVGFTGLADWLAKNQTNLHDLDRINDLFDRASYSCIRASVDLAMERGVYPMYKGSEWSKGKILCHHVEWFEKNSKNPNKWRQLFELIQKYGIRNSHLMAIAPNTSSSLIQGCTASILPVFKRYFTDKYSMGSVPIIPPYIKEFLWWYTENIYTDQQAVVNMTAVIQKWIDTGISMELLFNLNEQAYGFLKDGQSITAKDMFEVMISAWEKGIKAIYYIRTVQKDKLSDKKEECSMCAS